MPAVHESDEVALGVVSLTAAARLGAEVVGTKAFNLARLAKAGLPVPAGFVVTDDALRQWQAAVPAIGAAVAALGAHRFAVRSSAAAEDLAGASFAGQYDTLLDVAADQVPAAVRRVFESAVSDRVDAYRRASAAAGGAGMAVLVQPMIAADAAGVAFTAHPVTGERAQVVITAVRGIGERLVAGETPGEEWVVDGETARRTRPAADEVLDVDGAERLAVLARRVEAYFGSPQDIEWASTTGQMVLLQARPMTALPDPVSWTPPVPGWWMRNFRLGEWLPEPLTPLFADWLLPVLDHGTAIRLRAELGMPLRTASVVVNGWYYTSPPPRAEAGFGRWLVRHPHILLRVPTSVLLIARPDRAAAHLARLTRGWREELMPRYRRTVEAAAATVESATPGALIDIVEAVGTVAGEYLWSTWTVAGSQWKIEAALARFCRRHLPELDVDQAVLAVGLPGTEPDLPDHAVHSLDWYWPTAGESSRPLPAPQPTQVTGDLAARRRAGEERCRAALSHRPRLRRRFDRLLALTQHYAVVREQQTRALSLGWPLLRRCALRLGEHLSSRGMIRQAPDVFFCTRAEIDAALSEPDNSHAHLGLRDEINDRRALWQRQRRLDAPWQIGSPPRIAAALSARIHPAPQTSQAGTLVTGQGASPGRATATVKVILDPTDAHRLQPGDILVTRTTTPAWTPLLAIAAAVVTDIGTLAAHASLVAREFGIPAVVGTTNATTLLHDGQTVTVDGSTGIITQA